MPTLEALETAIADYKRTQGAFADLIRRRDEAQALLNVIDGQLSTAKASVAANEAALRSVAAQYATEAKRAAR